MILENGDAIRCRTVRRVPFDERWNADKVFSIIGTPKLPAPSRRNPHAIDCRNADEGPPQATGDAQRARPPDQPDREFPEPAEARHRDVDIRELRITDKILDKFGGPDTYTPGCMGCDAKQAGTYYAKGHSLECRQRIYEEMKKTVEGREMLARKDERMKRKAELIGASRGGKIQRERRKSSPTRSRPQQRRGSA